MFGDKFNLGSLLKNAKKMQEMMEQTQSEFANTEITGESGAGAVQIIMTGKNYVKKIQIDDEILKEPKEILEELIASAFNNASSKVEEMTKARMMDAGKMFSGMAEDEKES